MPWFSGRSPACRPRTALRAGSVLAVSLLCSVSQAQTAYLESPIRFPQREVVKDSSEKFSCPYRTRALTDMSGMFGFYQPDKTMSVVDSKKMSDYTRKMWPTKVVKEGLSTLVVDAVAANSEHARSEARRCILGQSTLWADKRAMLSGLEDNTPLGHRQAVLEILWTGIAFTNAYAIADQIAPVEPAIKARTDPWFEALKETIVTEFTPRPRDKKDQWLDAHANHWLWAGASVGSIAIILQDRAAFDWSMNILQTALDEAPEDGSLPRELKRGQRSLHYQNFAMAAISTMVAMADRNGVSLNAEQEAKLKAMAIFSADAYENPAAIEEMTGKKQEKRASMLTWAAPLSLHFAQSDAALSKRLAILASATGMTQTNACALICLPAYLPNQQF